MIEKTNNEVTYYIWVDQGRVESEQGEDILIYKKQIWPKRIVNDNLIVRFGSSLDEEYCNDISVPKSRNIGAINPMANHLWFADQPENAIDHQIYRQLFYIRGHLIARSTGSEFITGYSRVDTATGSVEESWPANEYREPGSRIKMENSITGIDETGEVVIIQTSDGRVAAIDDDLNVQWAYDTNYSWGVKYIDGQVSMIAEYARERNVVYYLDPETGEIVDYEPKQVGVLTPEKKVE